MVQDVRLGRTCPQSRQVVGSVGREKPAKKVTCYSGGLQQDVQLRDKGLVLLGMTEIKEDF